MLELKRRALESLPAASSYNTTVSSKPAQVVIHMCC